MLLNNNYRLTIVDFIPLKPADQPHSTQLNRQKETGIVILDDVRGSGPSSIEKMTQPLATPDEDGYSPYMIDLLGRTTTLAFAERTLQMSRKRMLDSLGIDDSAKPKRQARLFSDHINISRFYTSTPIALTLNGDPFIEQEPTSPYFRDQRIITPDFRIYRRDEKNQEINLIRCRTHDDSAIGFDPAPIEQLKSYNDIVYKNEQLMRASGQLSNKARYFIEMIEYLAQKNIPGDFIVQNPLESSSDQATAHFQYIPNHVPLPLFSRLPQCFDDSPIQFLDWYLPTLAARLDLDQNDWQKKINALQQDCQELLSDEQISTTPLFRMSEKRSVDIYLIFKKNCSTKWTMTTEETGHAPGWLESCGIFVTGSPKAAIFESKGAQNYYATYSVGVEKIDTIKQKLTECSD
ncbi:hypothetical protein [Pseudomonas sp. RL_5y_Pfl2_73]|uniref:hypothetical protein n=1 Tax=Pseudomonas sp. RL_5y_Pfl2_73 TaxID=3088713 RepID=UPI0030D9F1B5